ncbi:DNA repair exonuclease [Thiovulum sp. ES]|nr:DNA repair exonuclease [Thiovulum sp. ES]
MFQAVTIKDPHFRFGFDKPIGRTDTFFKDIKTKLDFIIDYGSEQGIDTLITTGDVFDIKATSRYDLSKINKNLSIMDSLTDQFFFWLSISGNHDLPFSSIDNKAESFYFYAITNGIIEDIAFKSYTDRNVTVYGLDFTSDLFELKNYMAKINKDSKKLKDLDLTKTKRTILVIHEHVIPDGYAFKFGHHLLYSEIASLIPDIDILVAGHLHKGFKTVKQNNTWIVNPWSFTRLARNYYSLNDEHIPQFSHIKITESGDISIQDIDIPHKSYKEAFIEEDLDRILERDTSITEFTSSLSSFYIDNNLTEIASGKLKARIEHYLELAGNLN